MGLSFHDEVTAMAAAIANARGNRRGVPTIANILDMLPENLVAEVMEDAECALRALEAARAADAPSRPVSVERRVRRPIR